MAHRVPLPLLARQLRHDHGVRLPVVLAGAVEARLGAVRVDREPDPLIRDLLREVVDATGATRGRRGGLLRRCGEHAMAPLGMGTFGSYSARKSNAEDRQAGGRKQTLKPLGW